MGGTTGATGAPDPGRALLRGVVIRAAHGLQPGVVAAVAGRGQGRWQRVDGGSRPALRRPTPSAAAGCHSGASGRTDWMPKQCQDRVRAAAGANEARSSCPDTLRNPIAEFHASRTPHPGSVSPQTCAVGLRGLAASLSSGRAPMLRIRFPSRSIRDAMFDQRGAGDGWGRRRLRARVGDPHQVGANLSRPHASRARDRAAPCRHSLDS